jgi:hypothetical protein
MNRTILNVAIFVVGAGIGFLAGKKVYEGYYNQLAQEEIDSVKDAFEKYKLNLKKPAERVEEEDELSKEEVPKIARANKEPLVRSSIESNQYEKAKRNYAMISRTEEEIKATATDEVDEAALIDVDRTRPYVISDVEFSEEFDHHDKLSLYYYKEDEVLCDEHEEVLCSSDVEDMVSTNALTLLETQNIIWVRNEPKTIDYEITVLNGSYSELVQGIPLKKNLSPREAYAHKQKGKKKSEE